MNTKSPYSQKVATGRDGRAAKNASTEASRTAKNAGSAKEEPRGKKKFDAKKMVIYSEIMNPKFKE